MDWPTVIAILGSLTLVLLISIVVTTTRNEGRKIALDESRAEELRQLIDRYEELVAGATDVQKRSASDLAELRARVTSVETILLTVE